VTRDVNHENLTWARSAWAGSQRYPLHGGGDAMKLEIGLGVDVPGLSSALSLPQLPNRSLHASASFCAGPLPQ
jgi:hypothetical protein